MINFKKLLRLLWLIVFMILASVGVGLGGGVPLPLSARKRDATEVQTELPESDKKATKIAEFKRKE
ncbi:hypothetical protein [Flavobacterium cerinum]|uniref:Uncharacterized protein n=1 Tax=Flavobacterium cerinum TaxID=2502784 RepID=A0A444HDL1_9FLAO|nr:hypothetical protein [Flavobacterium cerinum]RWX02247.1 hypothetical protein EPI11_03250 [Flavobacterium cerinum]